jgi:phospholipid transport system transporter-binding protein
MLILPDSITHTTAVACLDALKQSLVIETSARVTVDASGLSRFDSAALSVLLDVRREILKLGKTFTIQCMPKRLGDLARLYGIAELLPTNT